MELVSGGELFNEITKNGALFIKTPAVHYVCTAYLYKLPTIGKLSEDVARKYTSQLIDGLSYCHKAGIVHRNLKVCKHRQFYNRNFLPSFSPFLCLAIVNAKLFNFSPFAHIAIGRKSFTR